MYDQKWPYLEQIATELLFMETYSESIQGLQKKCLQKYTWVNIFKTPLEVDLPLNTYWF